MHTFVRNIRCQTNKWCHCYIVSNANDEDKPELRGKVFYVFQADPLSNYILLSVKDFLCPSIKQSHEYGTRERKDTESKSCKGRDIFFFLMYRNSNIHHQLYMRTYQS